MRYCPKCGHAGQEERCPLDGESTVEHVKSTVPTLPQGELVGGRYRVTEAIGRGGFGVVYEAEHVQTQHAVAIKVLHVGQGANEEELAARFFREAASTARLSHPNTVRVFDFGQTEQGNLYLTMERLVGHTLQERLNTLHDAGALMSISEAVEIGVAVLGALSEAHAQGLVHRDLKPANIFLHRVAGGDSIVKVLDFGIVKDVDTSLTQTGQALGTPTHMSPEQAMGKAVDPRSDLYALGCLLFECVTGQLPYYAESPLALVMQHVTEPVPSVQQSVARPLPSALCEVIETALAKEPDDRWQGAQQMRAALQSVPQGHASVSDEWVAVPSATHRPQLTPEIAAMETMLHDDGLVWEEPGEEPSVGSRPGGGDSAVDGTVILDAVPPPSATSPRETEEGSTASGSWGDDEAVAVAAGQRQESAAEASSWVIGDPIDEDDQDPVAASSPRSSDIAVSPSFHARPTLGGAESGGGQRAPSFSVSNPSEVASSSAVSARAPAPLSPVSLGGGRPAESVHDSAIRAALAADDLLRGLLHSTNAAHQASIAAAAGLETVPTSAMWIASDGRAVAHGDGHGNVRLTRFQHEITETVRHIAADGDVVQVGEHQGLVMDVVALERGQKLASVGADRTLRIWDTTRCEEVGRVEFPVAPSCLALSRDEKLFVVGLEDGAVTTVSAPSISISRTMRGHKDSVTSVVAAGSRSNFLSAGSAGAVRAWDPVGGGARLSLRLEGTNVAAMDMSTSGKVAALACWDGTLRIWSPATGNTIASVQAHDDVVAGVAVFEEAGLVATVADDKIARVWSLDSLDCVAERADLTMGGKFVRFREDGRCVYVGCWDGSVCRLSVVGPWL